LHAQPAANQGGAGNNQQPPPFYFTLPPAPERQPDTISLTDWIISISTVFIMIWAFLQWREMVGAGAQTDKIIAAAEKTKEAAEKSAKASRDFADTAAGIDEKIGLAEGDFKQMAANSEGAIKATQDAMRSDQRAWVVVKGIQGAPQLGQPWEINVVFANTGRTPAKNVKISCSFESEKMDAAFLFKKSPYDEERTLIVPNEEPFCVLPAITIPTVTQDTLDVLINRKMKISVFGSLDYEDVFRAPYWLTFCKTMRPDGKAWNDCNEGGNDTGDGKNPN
jgi:hypothetical protein